MIKGIHYRSPGVYRSITKFLLGRNSRLRFQIASGHLSGSRSVLDICAGPGLLRDHLPAGCSYTAVDASPEFVRFLKERKIDGHRRSIEQDGSLDFAPKKFDAAVMIVSLCQFRPHGVDGILERLKKAAKKCVVVEDVKARPEKWRNALMNYFCSRDFTRPYTVFTREEFESLLSAHGFSVSRRGDRYSCAVYESKE